MKSNYNLSNNKYNENLNTLLHGEGVAISASLITGVKYKTQVFPYKNWRQDFVNDFVDMENKHESKAEAFQAKYEDIKESFDGNTEDIYDSAEYISLRQQVRHEFALKRWDEERFFIDNSSSETHSQVLGGIDSDGNLQNWTPGELDIIQESTNRPPLTVLSGEILGIERMSYEIGHGYSMSLLPDDMETSFLQEGRIYTPKGHLIIEHDGNYNNPSTIFYDDVRERFEDIRDRERNYYYDRASYDELLGIATGIITGSISAIIKYRELSEDPKPWNRRKVIQISSAFLLGGATGLAPYFLILKIHNPTRIFIEDTLADTIFKSKSLDTLMQGEFFDSLVGASGDYFIIMSAIALRTLLQGGIQINRVGWKESIDNSTNTLKRTSAEQGCFFILNLLLDNITPIPDPTTATIITCLRISYSAGKIGLSLKHKNTLAIKKIDYLHDAAYAGLV